MDVSGPGIALVVAVLAPNVLHVALPPRDGPLPPPEGTPVVVRALATLERVGQAGCVAAAVTLPGAALVSAPAL
uniref:hypothetical protein n=1 Tax=Actinotalea sp. JY-7885 TaxID=2758576 RepID=UPI001CB74EFE